jgi:hypothetical protein
MSCWSSTHTGCIVELALPANLELEFRALITLFGLPDDAGRSAWMVIATWKARPFQT